MGIALVLAEADDGARHVVLDAINHACPPEAQRDLAPGDVLVSIDGETVDAAGPDARRPAREPSPLRGGRSPEACALGARR
mmetsp:Transcript_6126/g.18097  ORF Transcript_6126/g.18097 Transcript_6126/m.18097 type:complete len:81 (+) Transcript_6126:596-838(+)